MDLSCSVVLRRRCWRLNAPHRVSLRRLPRLAAWVAVDSRPSPGGLRTVPSAGAGSTIGALAYDS
eukprot:15447121-Alexandrium_andersonii.AAC.1